MARAKSKSVAHSYAVRLMEHLVVPTFVIDPKRRVVIWNRACERLTGVAASEVLGTSNHWRAFYQKRRYCLADLVALDRPDRLAALYAEYGPSDTGVGLSAENWCVMPKLGNQLYLAIDAGPIHDEAGNLIAVVETLRDMTDQKRAEQALQALASKDGLTGLANRRCFDSTLQAEWTRARRTQRPLALLFVDVDHFKLYNDRHGHQSGDECLRAVASVVGKTACRPADLVARYGGEEFAIIMPETDHETACEIAERLRKAVMGLKIAHGAAGAGAIVTLSVGVAADVPGDTSSAEGLLNQADQALYAAKALGRNRTTSAASMLADFARAGRRKMAVRSSLRAARK